MSQGPVDFVVAAFKSEDGAGQALELLKKGKQEHLIDIENAAVIRKDADGKVHINETADLGGWQGIGRGALIGGLLGLIFPPSILGTALVGGAIGGVVAKLRDSGFKSDRLERVATELTPNSSALVAVIDHTWLADLQSTLREAGAVVVTEAVGADVAAQLR